MVRSCTLCNKKKSDETTLHLFPKQPALLAQWKKACEFAYCDNVSTLRICSTHFQPYDYIQYSRCGKHSGVVKRLHPNAVPSVNIPNNRENMSPNAPSGFVLTSQTETVEGPAKKQKLGEHLFQAITDQPSTSMCQEIMQISTPKSSETIQVSSPEVATPKRARRALFQARFVQSELRYKIKKLQQDKRRLTKRISTLQDLVRVLRKKALISENCGDMLMDEVDEFVSGTILSPFPPQIRQSPTHAASDMATKKCKIERKRYNSNISSLDSEPPSPTPRISRPGGKYITAKRQLLTTKPPRPIKKPIYVPTSTVPSSLPPPTNLTRQDVMDLPIIFADNNQILDSTLPTNLTSNVSNSGTPKIITSQTSGKFMLVNKQTGSSGNFIITPSDVKKSSPISFGKQTPKYTKIILSSKRSNVKELKSNMQIHTLSPEITVNKVPSCERVTEKAHSSSLMELIDLENEIEATVVPKPNLSTSNIKNITVLPKSSGHNFVLNTADLKRSSSVVDITDEGDPDYISPKNLKLE